MPAATEYIPPTDTRRHPLLAVSQNERMKRRSAYRTALSYYEDDYVKQLIHDPQGNEPDYNVGINLVKLATDRTVAFLFPKRPTFEIDPTSPDETEEEIFLKNFFRANGGLAMFHKMAQRGFLSGHVWARVRPQPRIYKGVMYPTLSVLEPTSVTAYWKADDVANILWYEQRYMMNGVAIIEDHIRSLDGMAWTTRMFRKKEISSEDILQQQTSHGTPEDLEWQWIMWEQGAWEEVPGGGVHPYWVPPIIEWGHLPHPNDFYGQSEFGHQDLLDTINRLWSEISRIVHIHSDPKDVMTGTSPDEVEDMGSLLSIDNPNARVQRLSLNQGALSETLETVQKLTETYLAIARVVLLKGEAKDLQRVTNASVRTLFLDSISKNNLLQDEYGDGLAKIGELAIKMSNLPNRGANFPIEPKFPEALPIDMTELANVASIMHATGAWSLRTIRTKTGVDPIFEANNIKEEQEEALALQERQMAMAQSNSEDSSPVDET